MITDIHGDQANTSKVHNMTFDWSDGKEDLVNPLHTHTHIHDKHTHFQQKEGQGSIPSME
jgi:hypothetical protein